MTSNEWGEVKLDEVTSAIFSGGTPSTSRLEFWNGQYNWLSSGETRNRFIVNTEKKITELGIKNSSTSLANKYDVVIASAGQGHTRGQTSLCMIETYINQSIISVRANNKLLNPHFLFYNLNNRYGELRQISDANSIRGSLTTKSIKELMIILPPIEIQNKISSTLSCLDNKIELNRKINDNLANIIQSLYQEKYGHSGNAETNGQLADICHYSKARINVSELSLENYYSTENMLPNKGGAVKAASLPSIVQTTRCSPGDVLISNIRPYFKKLLYAFKEGGCSGDVLCLTPKAPSLSPYLFSTIYADRFFDFMVAGSKGTKMPRGDKQQIMTYPIYLPTKNEIDAFNDIASPILLEIRLNEEESKRLAAVRNTILPKLMSGDLSVDYN